jgi:hypothetical protein
LANKNAERSKSGVVGSNGRNIPITPNMRQIYPDRINRSLTALDFCIFAQKYKKEGEDK